MYVQSSGCLDNLGRSLLPALALATGLAAPTIAQAQAQAQAQGQEESAVLEAVIVTAQKRSESLQSVPVSVTALSSAQLGETKLDSPADLAAQIRRRSRTCSSRV